jgi:hypothetical protein
VFKYASKNYLKKENLFMKKRGIVVKFEDLPARSVQLSEDSMEKIFGGCKNFGESCEVCSCCGGHDCTPEKESLGTFYYCR